MGYRIRWRTGKKKRHGDRGAKKVLAIPRAVLEPERLHRTPFPSKLAKQRFEIRRHFFRFRTTSQAKNTCPHLVSDDARSDISLINSG
ncbi:hypothetical protein DO65_5565 [Burkholderia pseudomallei]|nr:hypothetical protein DO65_5565 [Burkholderia pseudomallei]KGS18220.1 hypothetical protein X989_4782 [Burkholderia pseudomallei MSHR4378]KGW35241.1 hypothetical protein Y602_5308 [Burkholderia pseudomallei MSHR733]KGX69085.1 hypothetical protein Y026_4705 [Burkholderia pseudomallei TSV28]KOS70307.1 hypothetical protein DM46_2960 [Burkholderia mallei]